MRSRLSVFAVLTLFAVVTTTTVVAQGRMRHRGMAQGGGYGMGSRGASGEVPGVQSSPLSQTQKDQIARIRLETRTKVQSVRLEPGLTDAQRLQKIDGIRQEGHRRVMTVLTNDQRREFYEWWGIRRSNRTTRP